MRSRGETKGHDERVVLISVINDFLKREVVEDKKGILVGQLYSGWTIWVVLRTGLRDNNVY